MKSGFANYWDYRISYVVERDRIKAKFKIIWKVMSVFQCCFEKKRVHVAPPL